jgi:small-conductance mechanosensitive channel
MLLVLQVLFVLSSHTWFRNVMGGLILLIDEPIKSGSHVKVLGHEGVVEHMYLQYFTVRQYDKGLAIIPNGVLLQSDVHVRSKSLGSQLIIDIHLSHSTATKKVRDFIRVTT